MAAQKKKISKAGDREKLPAQPKAKPGRPKKSADDKLEQFSIRLPPKLKFGLELLARAQHRSLSQAVEWALQVGLNNYEVGYAGGDGVETIGSVVERAWKTGTESGRLLAIYNVAPALLPFEDFKTCELVERSFEWEIVNRYDGGLESLPKGHTDEQYKAWEKERESAVVKRREIYYEFVDAAWKILRFLAVEMANAGKATQEKRILRIIGVAPMHGIDDFAILQGLTAQFRSNLSMSPAQLTELVLDLNTQIKSARRSSNN